MEVNIYEAKTNLSKLIQMLVDQNEESISICKNGTPIVQMTLIKKPSKRIGAMQDKYKPVSIEEFNSINLDDLFIGDKK